VSAPIRELLKQDNGSSSKNDEKTAENPYLGEGFHVGLVLRGDGPAWYVRRISVVHFFGGEVDYWHIKPCKQRRSTILL